MEQNSKGILFTLSSVIMFALMAVLVRLIPHVSSFHSSFVRFTIGLAIIGILAMFKLIPLNSETGRTCLSED